LARQCTPSLSSLAISLLDVLQYFPTLSLISFHPIFCSLSHLISLFAVFPHYLTFLPFPFSLLILPLPRFSLLSPLLTNIKQLGATRLIPEEKIDEIKYNQQEVFTAWSARLFDAISTKSKVDVSSRQLVAKNKMLGFQNFDFTVTQATFKLSFTNKTLKKEPRVYIPLTPSSYLVPLFILLSFLYPSLLLSL
jgi:hypothetical protein